MAESVGRVGQVGRVGPVDRVGPSAEIYSAGIQPAAYTLHSDAVHPVGIPQGQSALVFLSVEVVQVFAAYDNSMQRQRIYINQRPPP